MGDIFYTYILMNMFYIWTTMQHHQKIFHFKFYFCSEIFISNNLNRILVLYWKKVYITSYKMSCIQNMVISTSFESIDNNHNISLYPIMVICLQILNTTWKLTHQIFVFSLLCNSIHSIQKRHHQYFLIPITTNIKSLFLFSPSPLIT